MTITTYIIIIAAVLAAVYGLWVLHLARKIRQARVQSLQQAKDAIYPTACAGSDTSGKVREASSASVSVNKFFTPEGHPINPADFRQFVVIGNSMSLCGINDGNLLFVDPNSNSGSTEFPQIIVVRRRNPQPEAAQYKVRRAWFETTISADLISQIDQLATHPKFHELLSSRHCKGLDYMKKDLTETRVPRYKENYPDCEKPESRYHDIVLSTTFHTDTDDILFSIHPVEEVVGRVVYSFTIPQTNI